MRCIYLCNECRVFQRIHKDKSFAGTDALTRDRCLEGSDIPNLIAVSSVLARFAALRPFQLLCIIVGASGILLLISRTLYPEVWRGKDSDLKRTLLVALVSVASFVAVALEKSTVAQSSSQLNVTYGSDGIQRLSYAGTVLEDLNQYPSDAFHIWHMKLTDLQGKLVTGGQYGWGEINNGRSWNAANHRWTYSFVWGSIQVQFLQNGNNLDMIVTETNLPNSGVVLDGAVVYPLGLHMPQLPVKFYDANYPQLAFNTTGPSVTVADYGAGEVAAVVPDATKPLYSGFSPAGNGIGYFPIISGTSPDGLATFQPHNDRPVQPGHTETFTVSLRFAPSGTPTKTLAADAYASWAKTWPAQLKWTDRRAIGTVFLASSPSGNVNQPSGYPNNPRRYFNDSGANVNNPAGLAAFQARVLQQAASNVGNMQKLNAQGSITWDIEGE